MNTLFVKQTDGTHTERPQSRPKTLADAPGVQVGKSIEWAHGNAPAGLTDRERESIRRALGVNRLNEPRCLEIKRMAITMPCAEIIRRTKGRKGWSESTVSKVHAALSRAKGEGLR